jgi:hypothetical protein
MIKLVDLLKENTEGDYEYMLYSLYADENNIKQQFSNSKVIKIKDGIKIEFPEPYYIDEGFDDDPIEEGWGIFNYIKILVQENAFKNSPEFQYNIYIEGEEKEPINYNEEIMSSNRNRITNIQTLHNWLNMFQPAFKYYN